MQTEDYVTGRVSVIIPAYNYGRFIRSAINSALRQRVSDLEIIVVDDGSTDKTKDILGQYKYRINYIYQENSGLSAARNTGISNSTGEFIQFLDADDVLGPDVIASQLDHLKRHREIYIVVCRNRLFKETTPHGQPVAFDEWRLFRENLEVHLCCFNIAPPHAFLFRREAIIDTGWFDTKLKACEDYDFWLRAATRGFVPYYNPTGFVYHRRHSGSMSANVANQYLHDAILHKRLSAKLDQYPQFPKGKRLEGLLAFSSGALLTASRLHELQLEGSSALIKTGIKRLEDAIEIATLQESGCNILIKLFCFRIVSYLTHPCFKGDTSTVIWENLRRIMGIVNAPASRAGILANTVMSSVFGFGRFVQERRELRSLAKRYIKRRVFRCFESSY